MKKTVKVVFKEDVDNHLKGDEVVVALGYARNFLFPQSKAIDASDKEAKKLIKDLKEERKKRQEEINKIHEAAKKVEGKKITIKEKASKTGKLFGSVNNEEILKELGLKDVKIKTNSIKTIGEHRIELDFSHGIKTKIVVEVKEK